MSSSVLGKGHSSLRHGLLKSRAPFNNQSIRSVSLNSAIGKGLRKSQGVGFRGKERERDQRTDSFERNSGGFRDRVREKDHRALDNRPDYPPSHSSSERWRSSRNDDYEPRGGERSHDYGSKFSKFESRKTEREWPSSKDSRGIGKPSRNDRIQHWADPEVAAHYSGRPSPGRRAFLEKTRPSHRQSVQSENFTSPRRGGHDDGQNFRSNSRDGSNRLDGGDRQVYGNSKDGFKPSDRGYPEDHDVRGYDRSEKDYGNSRDGVSRPDRGDRQDYDARGYDSSERGSYRHDSKDSKGGLGKSGFDSSAAFRYQENPQNESSVLGPLPDKRMPLSIPYTTPASEFLYGTSVVEAALTSTKEPRRKLYKLYIYTVKNREDERRDASIEMRARKKGIEVIHVNNDWLRLMDKMSGGRPHNGFILEASPLPKLPVISLGRMSDDDQSKYGFSVVLDHQSREEAAINGTSNFIELPENSVRKPFVLFLDSIQDPGNLGGIIRSASFLGVTAIAISTRNSASFTPVVMKASAGSMEQVTIFSIEKPLAFLENSKAAGWKIFAAVAPIPHPKHSDPPSMTIDELSDPLLDDPCMLVLGNEGEGLRWNLRSRADHNITIPGSKNPNAVNSLNVSVAAGILCSAFFRQTSTLST